MYRLRCADSLTLASLGYEIYTTADFALKLWDTLWQAGKKYGLIAAGRGAFNSMRLEKGYRSYGTDMNSEHNPHEAGLSFAVRKGGGYKGAEAFNELNPNGLTRRLVCLVLENPQHVVLGKEPVMHQRQGGGLCHQCLLRPYHWQATRLCLGARRIEHAGYRPLYPIFRPRLPGHRRTGSAVRSTNDTIEIINPKSQISISNR